MFATLDMTILAGLAFDTNGRFIGLLPSSVQQPRSAHVPHNFRRQTREP